MPKISSGALTGLLNPSVSVKRGPRRPDLPRSPAQIRALPRVHLFLSISSQAQNHRDHDGEAGKDYQQDT
ncbi:MAG: hypothetical protein JWL84_3564 [Rhodospirillales bacterium]|nr:hypothetical protein [Rhodospirillales bacterium]